jgi:hypothetical protein
MRSDDDDDDCFYVGFENVDAFSCSIAQYFDLLPFELEVVYKVEPFTPEESRLLVALMWLKEPLQVFSLDGLAIKNQKDLMV